MKAKIEKLSAITLKVVHMEGRMIFYVSDVGAFWAHLKEKGFEPNRPADASWGERYFHVRDPDGYRSRTRDWPLKPQRLQCDLVDES